jgi:hypothetical protein
VCIVLGVAGITVGRQVGKDGVRVALCTGDLGMSTGQGKLRLWMIEISREPGCSGVTRITAGTKLTFVSIILGMAGVAGSIKGSKDIIEMAFCTSQAGMGTSQGELRLWVVESSREPSRGGMTRIATGAKLTFVSIILGMARVAGSINGSKGIIEVAFCTIQVGMGTCQGKLRLWMVETSRNPPIGGMTCTTASA